MGNQQVKEVIKVNQKDESWNITSILTGFLTAAAILGVIIWCVRRACKKVQDKVVQRAVREMNNA